MDIAKLDEALRRADAMGRRDAFGDVYLNGKKVDRDKVPFYLVQELEHDERLGNETVRVKGYGLKATVLTGKYAGRDFRWAQVQIQNEEIDRANKKRK